MPRLGVTMGNQGLGMVAAAAAKNELQAVPFIFAVLFPSLPLPGAFYPLEAIPGGLRPPSWFVPRTYANDAMRSVLLRCGSAGDTGLDWAVLGAYAVLTLRAAAFFLRGPA